MSPKTGGIKAPLIIVCPPAGPSSTSVLPAPIRNVDGSTVALLKQVPPVMVAVPVPEKNPCASGPVWVRARLMLEVGQ